jgi:hypothetical protein
MKRVCIVCRKPYYRRNQSITWHRISETKWKQIIARGHPQCLRLYRSVAGMFKRSAA